MDPLADSFVGFVIAQLIFAASRVFTMTRRVLSGLISITFAAVPARRAVLAAEAGVISVTALAAAPGTALAAFLAGQAILSSQHLGISLAIRARHGRSSRPGWSCQPSR